MYSRRALVVALLLVALLSWTPAWLGPRVMTPFDDERFWANLSSNLFASVVFATITMFGLDVLLEGIAQRSPKNAAVRRLAIAHSEWIFNRLHGMAPQPFNDHIPELSDPDTAIPRTIANAWVARGADIRASLRKVPVETSVQLANALLARLDAIRSTAAVASSALDPRALDALLSTTAILEVIRDRLPAACAEIDHPTDMAKIQAMLTGELIADCVGYLAIVHRYTRTNTQ